MEATNVYDRRHTTFSVNYYGAFVRVKPAYEALFSKGKNIDIILEIENPKNRMEFHLFPEVNPDRNVNLRKELMVLYNALSESETQRHDVRIWANKKGELMEHCSIKALLEDERTKFMLQGRTEYGDAVKILLFAFFKGGNRAGWESAEVRIALSPSLSEQRRDKE